MNAGRALLAASVCSGLLGACAAETPGEAAARGDLAALEAMSRAGAALEAADSRGMTALHRAAEGSRADALRWLLDRGVPVDVTDARGWTALHYAAASGSLETVTALLGAGASPNVVAEEGFRPLHVAAIAGHGEVAAALVRAGADVDAAAQDGLTAEGFARRRADTATAEAIRRAAGGR